MKDFGIPKKLVKLVKMEGTQYQIRVENRIPEEFEVSTCLNQGDTLSPVLFNTALKKLLEKCKRKQPE